VAWKRTVVGIGVLSVGYAVLAYAGLQWATFGGAVSPVWPATGLGIAVLLIGGKRLWPGVFLGTLLATSLIESPDPLLIRLVLSASASLGIFFAAWLLKILRGFDLNLRRPADVVSLCALGGPASSLVSGAAAVAGLVLLGGMPQAEALGAYVRWIVGDLVGTAVVAPVVLTWARPDPLPRRATWWFWFALLFVITGVVSWATYVHASPMLPLMSWHVVPLLVAAAFLLDARGATTINLVSAVLALYGQRFGGAAFYELQHVRLFGAQQYVLIVSVSVALVAVMVEALRRARTAVANEPRYLASAENEARLLLAQEAGQVGTWDWRLDQEGALCSETMLEVFGWPRDRPLVPFRDWVERVHPEDRDRAVAEVEACADGREAYSSEYRILLPSGEVRHIDSRARLFHARPGSPARIVGVVVDVTERERAEEKQRLLMREIDHRAKNALAVVQAVVRLTRAERKEDFAAAVEGRIHAIARAHNLLAASSWSGADLRALLRDEAAPYGDRIRLSGPDLTLDSDAAQPLGLVMHELLTNAAKHGALSVPQGRVEVSWVLEGEPNRLHLRWAEHGGPPPKPPESGGFGSTLLTATIERQLYGRLRQEWLEEGLSCEIDLPAGRVVGGRDVRAAGF
jgi:PAS domain S-box-containing protein